MRLDAVIAFTQASYRNMKRYFTSKLIEHNKNSVGVFRLIKNFFYDLQSFQGALQ